MLPTVLILSSQHRQIRSFTQDVIPFLNNNLFQYTNPLSLEIEAHSINTKPLLKEHLDSYLNYLRYKILDITQAQPPFQIVFNSIPKVSGTFYRTIFPQNCNII